MVAPTRAPQARGVKCELCKKILTLATWLDQTKLAKTVEDAQIVLDLIRQHGASDCPCIPKSIENLLVGSTHFEIHRLTAKRLDSLVHRRQCDFVIEAKQKAANESVKHKNEVINDCHDVRRTSRFKVYEGHNDQKHCEQSKLQLKHLYRAIDAWIVAMEDQANPFNPKLALRLGLTHHVIYACYLFKYYKILDYQLSTANLLLNLFKSIEGVTANAILHANYLLVKTLLDCNQLSLARVWLKHATKIRNYQDKTHYESILLTCVACESSILDNDGDIYNNLDDLAALAVIKPDDKLQHYYARTLAISIIIKYIHCYRARSSSCFEFYHTFRYICAIIRRCYESSFELVLSDKDTKSLTKQMASTQQVQILDHSWIRFAVSDFVFSTFDLLSNFYIRAGQPECLELIFNGLNLVAYRNGSCYWQTRMASIGSSLDLLCDKYDHAKAKLDVISRIIGHTSDSYLMNLLRLDSEVSLLALLDRQEAVITKEVVIDLLQRLKTCQKSLLDRICKIELYDCKLGTRSKTVSHSTSDSDTIVVLGGNLGHLSIETLKIAVASMLRTDNVDGARELFTQFGSQLNFMGNQILNFNDSQVIQETLLYFANVNKAARLLLDAVSSSHLFLESENDLTTIGSQLSSLTISSEQSVSSGDAYKRKTRSTKPKISSLRRRSKKKGTYDVAGRSERENMTLDRPIIRYFDTIEALRNFSTLTSEEIVVSYLRNSEPNPDYLLYRKAHELMFCFRLNDTHVNHDQILYHFCESSTSNTMRYRWMMLEEQQASPFDPPNSNRCNSNIKPLGFSSVLVNPDKTVKSLMKLIPEDHRFIQLKYILSERSKTEHLLIVTFDTGNEPYYVHVHRPVTPDDFFDDTRAQNDEKSFDKLTIPNRLASNFEEAKKTLLLCNQKTRSEKRHKIEVEIRNILLSLEDDWLGPFRFLLCGKINDARYNKFVQAMVGEIRSIMSEYSCNSLVALQCFVENAPFLSREEFCKLISSLFNGTSSCADERSECFNRWTKTIESFIAEQMPSYNKATYLQTLPRGQMGLIIDGDLEMIPFESLPIVRITRQAIFRVPSLRLFSVMASRTCTDHLIKANVDSTVYILDPACNLAKTREKFDAKLRAQKTWLGCIGEPPKVEELESWLASKQVYLFIGHGAGTAYYNKLCKGRGLSAMAQVSPLPIVMGCSSGRMMAEGPRLESFGIGWVFVFRGAPAYVGLLWDVTDTDIDRFLDNLLARWMGTSRWNCEPPLSSCDQHRCVETSSSPKMVAINEAVARARSVCKFEILVGSAPVVYGLPVWCEHNCIGK